MQTQRLLAACILLSLFAGSAGAHGPYTVTKAALAPGTTDVSGAAIVGTAACVNPVATPPALCGGGGLGVFISLARDASAVTDAPIEPGVTAAAHHHHAFVIGTCGVERSIGIGARFVFTCGVDRNNDGLVTDAPVCAIESPVTGAGHITGSTVSNHDECTGQSSGGASEDHADDWVDGSEASGPVAFCFQDDVRGFTDRTDDDDGANDISVLNQHVSPVEHGDGWSDIVVFVGSQVPNTASFVGVVSVTVTVEGAASCGMFNGGLVSAHTTAGNVDTDGNGRSTPAGGDTLDNDGDGLADGDDPDCDGNPSDCPQPVPLCGQEFDNGQWTTWPCPPELCGLDQGSVALRAEGAPFARAPVGTLMCHDDAHMTTGFRSTSAGSFDGAGRWLDVGFGTIFSGTHAHCTLDAATLAATTYARVQCGKQ